MLNETAGVNAMIEQLKQTCTIKLKLN